MSSSLDLNLLPIVRKAGQDQAALPGLYIAEPPRRATRSRRMDRLILYLSLEGNAPLASAAEDQILSRLAKTFYDSSGSVTAALRSTAEALNEFLLQRNLQNASTGRQELGLLSLLALHGGQLYLTQSGPVHAFWATASQVQHLYDPQTAGRGLGVSRTTPVRYFQIDLQPNELLLLASQPAPTWSVAGLTGIQGHGPESLRRRLLNRASPDLDAVLIQARAGSGKITLLAPRPAGPAAQPLETEQEEPDTFQPVLDTTSALPAAEAPLTPPAPVETPPASPAAAASEAQPTDEPPGLPVAAAPADAGSKPVSAAPAPQEPAPGGQPPAPADSANRSPVITPAKAVLSAAQSTGNRPAAQTAPTESTPPVTPTAPAPRAAAAASRPRPSLAPVGAGLLAVFRPLAAIWRGLVRAIRAVLGRLLPNESLVTLPASTMALIAIAVPLVVVSVASMVYFQRGRSVQYQSLYAHADQTYRQAASLNDPLARREAWKTTLAYLDQADSYLVTSESQKLRIKVRDALDELDLVRRVNYQPALTGLPEAVRVTRIVSSGGDLYMLDSYSGSVIHAQETNNRGFEVDAAFQCGPGATGYAGGPLIDLSPAPPTKSPQAAVIAVDAKGNLLLCSPGNAPNAGKLPRPATAANWGKLTAGTVDPDLGHLYILDPADQAVWAYWNGNLQDQPQFYFGDVVPPLQDVVDLAANHDELYLLHADGHLTRCNFSKLQQVAPTRCVNSASFEDSRPGREKAPMVLDNPFTQIFSNQPPDPSLYLMDPKTQAVYRFSLQSLVFQYQVQPASDLHGGQATAFTVNNIDHTLFLATGNQVYYTALP
ncbi:MAG TPA: hypothetical protein VF823_08970 [Anaerolineales bacterium]